MTTSDLAPSVAARTTTTAFDPAAVRGDFPILSTTAHGRPLVYLDNGATTQKPRAVIDAVETYYRSENANIHRGVYQLSQTATGLYEEARRTVAAFVNAYDEREVIFTRGTTEGINLVASSWGRANLRPGDEVVVSAMEHHSNIVPWQMACAAAGAELRVIPMTDAGELQLDAYERLLTDRTKMVAVTHLANAIGTVNDVRRMAAMAHAVGALFLADGAQWIAHYPTDVRDLGVDFYVFSGHKLYGPTGIGVLWGRRPLLEAMPPYQGGGDMIERVTFERTTYAQLPNKFEAGTPNIAGAVGLAAAVHYVQLAGLDAVARHEHDLLAYATDELAKVPGLRIVGTAADKGSLISFVMENPPVASYDIGVALDREGIAVRTGHHCCQPVMDRLNINSTARASFAMYNTTADVDALAAALHKLAAAESAKRPATAPEPAGDEVKFPPAAAGSPAAAADELIELFDLLDDPQAQMQELIGMGSHLPHLPAALKTERTRVHGCQSVVHLYGRGRDGRVDFVADSDASLVRGLIALLEKVYAGQPAAAVLAFDVEGFLHRVGLDVHLSMGRRNGLEGMIRRVRELATAVAAKG